MSCDYIQSQDENDESETFLWTSHKVLMRINKEHQLAVICWREGSHKRQTFDSNQRQEALNLVQSLIDTDSVVIHFV